MNSPEPKLVNRCSLPWGGKEPKQSILDRSAKVSRDLNKVCTSQIIGKNARKASVIIDNNWNSKNDSNSNENCFSMLEVKIKLLSWKVSVQPALFRLAEMTVKSVRKAHNLLKSQMKEILCLATEGPVFQFSTAKLVTTSTFNSLNTKNKNRQLKELTFLRNVELACWLKWSNCKGKGAFSLWII